MSRKRKEFDEELAMKLYKEGKGWREIGRKLGIHPYSVQYWFNSQELYAKPTQRPLDLEKARELRDQGLSYRDIADIIGASFSAVQKAFKEI